MGVELTQPACALRGDSLHSVRISSPSMSHYATRYGELPIEEHLDFLHATELSEEQAQMVTKGMEVFVGVLGNMLGDGEPTH